MIDLSKIWPEWKIEKRIGRGAYGEVYKAVRSDYGIDSYSAIKIISIPTDRCEVDELFYEGLTLDDAKVYLKSVVDECVSEIRLMESLKDNSNIVTIEDYKVIQREDEIGWDIYIRMELLTPLNEFTCDRELSEEEIVKLGIDICNALQTCEYKNVIHRDIKPENIMVNSFGDFKLGDFGIARNFENMTLSLSRKGTMNYMAPEVANGTSDYDIRVDIYSLGLVLYKLLNNNRMPFLEGEKQLLSPIERKNATEKRLKGEPLPKPINASEKLSRIILKACEADPEKRYKSSLEMKKDLQESSGLSNALIKPEKGEKVKSRLTKKDYILIYSAILILCVAEVIFFVLNKNIKGKDEQKNVPQYTTEIEHKEESIDDAYQDNDGEMHVVEAKREVEIDYVENRKISKEAKAFVAKLREENITYYEDITYEKLVEMGCSDYAMYLISKEMIQNLEFEKAGMLVAHYINNEDFLYQFFNPSARARSNYAWDYRTDERYDYIDLTLSEGINGRVFYKLGDEDWTLVELSLGIDYPMTGSYYELRYDTAGNLVHERRYWYNDDDDISSAVYNKESETGKKFIEGIDYIHSYDYKKAKEVLSTIKDNKRADELIKICDFEIMYKDSSECTYSKLYELMFDEEFVKNYFSEEIIEFDYYGLDEYNYERVTTLGNDYRNVKVNYDSITKEIDSIVINGREYYSY